jgi:phage baseplate assembly protein W
MAPYPQIPHLSYPFQRSTDGTMIDVVEQDTVADITSCVNVILVCPMGARFERPDFGWVFPVFQMLPVDRAGLEYAIAAFEPRAKARIGQIASAVQAGLGQDEIEVELQIQGAQ